MKIARPITRLFLLIKIFYIINLPCTAQKNTEEIQFLQGKTYLSDFNYIDASEIFLSLFRNSTEKNELGACSGYLAAYSLFMLNKTRDANFVLYQLLQKYPKWSGVTYAQQLKATIQAKDRQWVDALTIWSKLQSEKKWEGHIRAQLALLPTDTLDLLCVRFPDFTWLIDEKRSRVVSQKTFEIMRIGLLIPLDQMYANSSIVDLYLGMKMAVDSLKIAGKKVSLHVFDTGKDSLTFASLLASGVLKDIDLCVGPLYGLHQKMMSEFSLNNQKVVFNPISQYGSYCNTNPYFYLFHPTYQTQGEALAKAAWAINTKQMAILYGDKAQDSLIAKACKSKYESLGGRVSIFRLLDKSVASYTGQILSKVPIDSLGKLVLCTSEPTLVSNAFAYLETTLLEKTAVYKETTLKPVEEKEQKSREEEKKVRVRDIPVFGYKDWLEINSISLEQFMIHETHFLNTDFIQKQNSFRIEKKFVDKMKIKPGALYYKTFDITIWAVEHLSAIYENSTNRNRILKAALQYLPGVDYVNKNDNGWVPIVKLENYVLQNINQAYNE